MSWKDQVLAGCRATKISWFDVLVFISILIIGFIYLKDCFYWGIAWIGESQYGDAQFWWSGANHIAQGLIRDAPGKGFRPGYFFLTGPLLPILGMQFKQFYPYFLVVFLTIVNLFYLSLRPVLGRWAAACVVGMLVFNPYTAEWVATSTSDGTGLLLHIAALTCLLFGMNNGVRRGWLIAFAILFSLATLTRPLMTPFIGAVLLVLFMFPRSPFKTRVFTTSCVLIAFCLPLFLWMFFQKLTINQWTISNNDASAFYAASDPSIQVWDVKMYENIRKIVFERYNIKLESTDFDSPLISKIFWEKTIDNYIRYPSYHFQRLAPHLWEMARFSPKISVHGTDAWLKSFMITALVGLILFCLWQRRFLQAAALFLLSFMIFFIPEALAGMTLLGATFGLFKKDRLQGIFLLSAYWWIGVIALCLVGGSWGEPSFSSKFAINALGYRLGSQVFFVGNLLAAYFMIWIANFSSVHKKMYSENFLEQTPFFDRIKSFIAQPTSIGGGIVFGIVSIIFMTMSLIYIMGSMIIVKRIYASKNTSIVQYPQLTSLMNYYQQFSGNNLIENPIKNGGLSKIKNNNADRIFTGTISSFIWNLQGQERAQIMVHTQKQIRPYTMGPDFVILEIPSHIDIRQWSGIQGAFIIHESGDNHNKSTLPYYLTAPAVRAFIPLSSDKKSFDLKNILWFPLVKNATQLETNGELQSKDAQITWSTDSGPSNYQRRFLVIPNNQSKNISSAHLLLDVTAAQSPATLSFGYTICPVSNAAPSADKISQYCGAKISMINESGSHSLYKMHESIQTPIAENHLKQVKFSIPANARTIEIAFNNLSPGVGVWLYEFNLSAKDFLEKSQSKGR